jgi:hypothetical protein
MHQQFVEVFDFGRGRNSNHGSIPKRLHGVVGFFQGLAKTAIVVVGNEAGYAPANCRSLTDTSCNIRAFTYGGGR